MDVSCFGTELFMQGHHESGTEHVVMVAEMCSWHRSSKLLEEDTVIKDINVVCMTSFIFDSIQMI